MDLKNILKFKISYILIILYCFIGCKNSTNSFDTTASSSSIQNDTIITNTSDVVASDTTSSTKNNEQRNSKVYKYVNAPSGLNFRDTPQGKVLGKFPDNLRLQILEVTDVTSEIHDSGKTITGNWVKVRAERATVYVFDAFLEDDYREVSYKEYFNELSILSLSIYYNKENNYYPFISLTDDYWNMRFPKVTKEYLENQSKEDTQKKYSFPIEGEDRARFLGNREINESDYLFIYNYKLDQLKQFQIKELMLFSHESIYGGSYQTGFDLKDLIDTTEIYYENTFAYIGKKSPFQRGKVKTIQWKPIDTNLVPKIELEYNNFFKSSNYNIKRAYHYSVDGNEYYYTNLYFTDNSYETTYLFIISSSEKLLYSTEIISNESRSAKLYMDNLKSNSIDAGHYTGQLFKNKPPVIYGLYDISFGCPNIDFLDSEEKSIYIQCDNRH